MGSNIVLTDDNQNILVRYEYDVFGAIRSETGTSDTPRKFTGKEYDSNARLYYFDRRYYDPYIGRFTQRDPAGDGGNWYAYTYNNPLRFIDPDGLRPLNPDETKAAQSFFGDMIDLEQVDIKDEGWLASKLAERGTMVTAYNSIYGKLDHETNDVGEITRVDSTLIHELAHVWQYNSVTIEPITAGVVQLAARAMGQKDKLYDYTVNSLNDPNRKTFREYSFEEQAAILEDAYLVLFLGDYNLKHNMNWRQGNLSPGEVAPFYQKFMDEFRQLHEERKRLNYN